MSTIKMLPVPETLDADLLNAFRLFVQGYDMTTETRYAPSPEVFNALAFAQSNDISQFYGTEEFAHAVAESVADIVAPIDWASFKFAF